MPESLCLGAATKSLKRVSRMLGGLTNVREGNALFGRVRQPRVAGAETVRILALGASNTNGKGVARSAAWPAQLEKMLKAKGINAKVAVNAVNGSTTSQMRARMKRAIAPGTKIVILDVALTNDRRRKVDTYANVTAIRETLQKRGIKLITMDRPHAWAEYQLQRDRIHFTRAGHRTVATKLLARVIEELDKPN